MMADTPAGRGLDAEAVKAAVRGELFVDLARELGGRFKRSGRDWRGPCFLHGGDGPNLVLTPERGLWHCLSSCGGGDALELVQRALGLEFGPALEWLAKWANVAPGERATRARAWAPTKVDPLAELAEDLLGKVWAVVADAPWSPMVARWLDETRRIEPDAAYALGCRDFTTRRDELAELVRGASPGVLEAVGWARGGFLHAAVRGALEGVPAVAVPVWRLGRAFPERWRWRWVDAPAGRPKSDSPFAGAIPADLLGVGRPDGLEGAEVRLARLGAEGWPGVVVLAEGEPDWWAATEALDGRAVVLGVCGSPKRWRDEWPSWHDLAALGVRRVAVCVHHGEPGPDGRGHGAGFAEDVAARCLGAGMGPGAVVRKLPAEGRDLADLHKAGELAGWFSDVLEGV
jgi:hypothetical protein